jgi:hypothetical protein
VSLPRFAESYTEFAAETAARFPAARWLKSDGPYYRPGARWLYHLWFAASAGDAVPWAAHAVQIALHVGCVGLLFLLLLQQTGSSWASSVGALTLGLHPSITPAVVYSSVAWCAIVTFVFLAAGTLYQRSLGSSDAIPYAACLTLPALLLFLALIAETGALAVGIVATWLGVTAYGQRDWRRAGWCLIPLVPVCIAYLVMRHLALGAFVSPYVHVDLGVRERIQTYAANLLYDASLLVNPVHVAAFDVDPASDGTPVLAGILLVLIVAVPVLHPRTRAFVSAWPLPCLGLALFFLFQSMALWLIPKVPIARAGIDRGHVYHLPVALLGLLLGSALHAAAARRPRSSRMVLGVASAAYLLAAALATRQSMRLWGEGGELLRRHEETLTPLLRALPEGTAVATQGLPDVLRRPYLPWAQVYSYAKSRMLSTWAGRPLRVYWEIQDAPPPDGFSGYVVEGSGATVRWRREDARAAVHDYIGRQSESPGGSRALLAERRPESPRAGLFLRAAEAQPSGADSLLVRLLDSDSSVALKTSIDPLSYGVIRYDLRILCADAISGAAVTQVYFRGEGQEFDELKSVRREVPVDGAWHNVRWALFQNARWVHNGPVDYLRLDLLDRKGTVELRALELQNDVAWARRVEASLEGQTP